MKLPRPKDDSDRRVLRDVRERGWHVLHVAPTAESVAGWSFTLGLPHSFDHPELLVFGLPAPTAQALLDRAVAKIAGGHVFRPALPAEGILDGYICSTQPVRRRWYRAFVGYALWFHQGDRFGLLQLFWPDAEGVFPWDAASSSQPLLYEPTPSAARVQEQLASMGLP